MVKLLFTLILVFSFNPLFAQTPGPASEKADTGILEKINAAQKGIIRFQFDSVQEINMGRFLHVKAEKILDIDYDQKVMREITEIKDYDFNVGDIQDAYLDRKVLEAQEKGVAEEKIQEMRAALDKMKLAGREDAANLSKNMKGAKAEVLFVDQMLYMHLKDKWVKMDAPFLKTFWAVAGEFQKGNIEKEGFLRAFKGYSAGENKFIEPMAVYMETVKHKHVHELDAVSESSFNGQPCYVLNIKNTNVPEIMEKTFSAYAMLKGGSGSGVKVNSSRHKEFVSKEKFLTLGVEIYFEMLFSAPRFPEPMPSSVLVNTVYSYPKGKIELPAELAQAVFVKNEEELKKIMKPDVQEGDRQITHTSESK